MEFTLKPQYFSYVGIKLTGTSVAYEVTEVMSRIMYEKVCQIAS